MSLVSPTFLLPFRVFFIVAFGTGVFFASVMNSFLFLGIPRPKSELG